MGRDGKTILQYYERCIIVYFLRNLRNCDISIDPKNLGH